MPNPYFRFKLFRVDQSLCAMKVGTDGAMLGAWTNVFTAQSILDVGCGSGLVSLMLAQRSAAKILAVDIDAGAVEQSAVNFIGSPWSDRLQARHVSVQDLCREAESAFDLVVCNPPFFSNSLKNPDQRRALARHSDTLSLSELVDCSSSLLSPVGRLSVVIPFSDVENVLSISKGKFFCVRQTNVIPVTGREPKRVLLELSKQKICESKVSELTIYKEGHVYTDEFRSLEKDYYLNF